MNNLPLPESIKNAPQLQASLQFYWLAFLELNTCRTEAGIPWTAVKAYADHAGIDDDEDFERLATIVRMMDSAYNRHREKKLKAKTDSSTPIATKQVAGMGRR